jgi:cobalt-precorrin 5A hydrolase
MMSAPLAIWALTPKGANLAKRLAERLPPADCFVSAKIAKSEDQVNRFTNFSQTICEHFGQYRAHIFIMAVGIVVRTIAGHLIHKTKDPAVVVLDEAGQFAISLISGHLGGANDLAGKAARITGGQAVITTATDVNQLPAIDVLAQEKGLKIINPSAIKTVNMALISGRKITLYDPYRLFEGQAWPLAPSILPHDLLKDQIRAKLNDASAGVLIDDRKWIDLKQTVLILRPGTLAVGVGCNRHTKANEMLALLETTFKRFNLAISSIATLASVDIKADEEGLLALAAKLNLNLNLYSRRALDQVKNVPTPSIIVKKHLGVNSVCEAAAILGAGMGPLIVPKHKSQNVTIAVARRDFTSSGSDRAASNTSRIEPKRS